MTSALPCLIVLTLACSATITAQATSYYYRHLIFDNSLNKDAHYYSAGYAAEPSSLKLIDGKLPVDREVFLTPPNALRLEWKSVPGGSWEAEIRLDRWRNRPPNLEGDTLSFWLYAHRPLPAPQLPLVQLRDSDQGFTNAIPLDRFLQDLPERQWVEVRVPLRAFQSISFRPFNAARTGSVSLLKTAVTPDQGRITIDEVRIDSAAPGTLGRELHPPPGLQAKGYDRHIDLVWKIPENREFERYVIYRALDGEEFRPIGIQLKNFDRFSDYLGASGKKARYKVRVSGRDYKESAFSEEATASTKELSDDQLLTMVQEASFRYYWDGAHPVSGMALENIPGDDHIVATGATGFGIMAIIAGAERGFVTHQEAVDRLLRIAGFLEKADRYHGIWPHFLHGETGKTLAVFGKYDSGADLVETSFLAQGMLAARQYFRNDGVKGRELYDRITKLWEGIEWDWQRRMPDSDFLYWHWSPLYTWQINHRLIGFNEVMITYLLAMSSPTHGVPAGMYYTGWASRGDIAAKYRGDWSGTAEGGGYVNGKTYYGIRIDVGVGTGGPLFFTHYSYLGFDPRSLTDLYTNYFHNNQAIARVNQAYCIDNPGKYPNYGRQNWGLTASDGPAGYVPHEPTPKLDTGTITPTGALSSFPYLPEASMEALRYFYRERGDSLWDIYGVRDAFNDRENWISPIFMGLNQAPIVIMIENYRTGLIWKMFMSNPEIGAMMERLNAETHRRKSEVSKPAVPTLTR